MWMWNFTHSSTYRHSRTHKLLKNRRWVTRKMRYITLTQVPDFHLQRYGSHPTANRMAQLELAGSLLANAIETWKVSRAYFLASSQIVSGASSCSMVSRLLSRIEQSFLMLKSVINTHTHPFNGPFSGTSTQVSWYQKGKPIRILLKQETVSGSGISWAICKSAPRSRQITTPAPHHSAW